MIVTEAIGKIHIAYKGKGVQKAPVEGSIKWNLYLSILNDKINGWASDPDFGWNTLFMLQQLTYVTTPIPTPDGFIRLADEVKIVGTNRSTTYKPTTVELRNVTQNAVYVSGYNPEIFTFTSPVPAEYIGMPITIPCYMMPPKLTLGSQTIVVDNIYWAINATASELARNDPAKDDQFQNLIGLSNVEYKKMQSAAKAIIHNQANSIPHRRTGFNIGGMR